VLIVVLATLYVAPARAQDDVTERQASAPTRADVREALDRVAKDPNLATERTVRTLRWVQAEDSPRDVPGWVSALSAVARFMRGLFGWFAASARVLLWVAAAILAALLVVFLLRLARSMRGGPPLPKRFVAPSHVRDLDIRPESLPDDVGAAAAALWDRGEHRAALALLYRALLSRLVHAYSVPILVSSTEGDCLVLAVPRLPGTASGYTVRLITVWQNAVYGGSSPAAATVHALCAEFAPVLDLPPAVRSPA
jgi:hypothetical protein